MLRDSRQDKRLSVTGRARALSGLELSGKRRVSLLRA